LPNTKNVDFRPIIGKCCTPCWNRGSAQI